MMEHGIFCGHYDYGSVTMVGVRHGFRGVEIEVQGARSRDLSQDRADRRARHYHGSWQSSSNRPEVLAASAVCSAAAERIGDQV